MLLSFEFIFLVLFVTVCSTVLSFNYDHQDILLQKIVFQIGDEFAIVECLVVECPSIREKNFYLEEKELFCERPLVPAS